MPKTFFFKLFKTFFLYIMYIVDVYFYNKLIICYFLYFIINIFLNYYFCYLVKKKKKTLLFILVMAPQWWPYALPVNEVFKRGSVLLGGVVFGIGIMNHFYTPFENLNDNFDNGRLYLLRCYNQLYEERLIREMENRSDTLEPLTKM